MCVRTSTTSYGSFILDMDRSPGFGSIITDYFVLFTLAFASAPFLKNLTLPAMITRRTVLQKVRRRGTSTTSTACKHRVSGSLSLPSRGPFHLSFTVLCAIGHWVVFSLTEWSPLIPTRFLVSRGTLDTAMSISISDTRLSLFFAGLPRPFSYQSWINYAVLTPENKSSGLGSFPFARRYLGHRCFFLFLRLLRCFSSAGSRPYVMYWRMVN